MTRDDFSDEAWLELCSAKLNYRLGFNRGHWWRALRKYGCKRKTGELETLIDLWLLAHPTWVRHQLKKQRPHANCEVCNP